MAKCPVARLDVLEDDLLKGSHVRIGVYVLISGVRGAGPDIAQWEGIIDGRQHLLH
jgi:hypothetical protein